MSDKYQQVSITGLGPGEKNNCRGETGGQARALANGGSPPPPREEAGVYRREVEGITLNFFPKEDAGVLGLVEKKESSPLADLYLHRQSLFFSMSPGFETLISLSQVRDLELLDYQLNTVQHVLKNLRGRALLCDEVGLGKTIEAGLIMMEYLLRGLVRRVLILVPPTLVEQWQGEMSTRFNLDFVSYDSREFKSHGNPWQEFPRIISSLDTAKREGHREKVLEAEYDLVIVDEAHHLKNRRTQAYQLVEKVRKKYILLLTATPVENSMEELFNLITLLLPGQLETQASFKKKYITRGKPLQPKNTGELKRLLQEVMVRNRRSETGVILSRRYARTLEIQLSPEEIAYYRHLTGFIREQYSQRGPGKPGGASLNRFVLKTLQRQAGSSIEAVIPTLEKVASHEDSPPGLVGSLREMVRQARDIPRRAKAEALLQLLRKLDQKVIVFTIFQKTHGYLCDLLEKEGFAVARLSGSMRRSKKEEELSFFKGEGQVLVSTETGSEGRNLQFCQVLVNYDLPWNPMRIEQRIGRLHRLGQEKDVYVYNLSAADTIESYILELLDAKINMFQLVVGELDMILGNLKEKADFEDLLMDIWAGSRDQGELQERMEELGQRLVSARDNYLQVKELDDKLLGELLPDD